MKPFLRFMATIIVLLWCLCTFVVVQLALTQPAEAQLATVPGATYAFVAQDNIDSTICTTGYTASIRPSTAFTNRLKARLLDEQQLTGTVDDYELDHLISLELGGHPSDVRNLWMQPYAGPCNARDKDRLETRLKRLVCTGHITLHQAQHEVRTDWVASYNKHIGTLECQ